MRELHWECVWGDMDEGRQFAGSERPISMA